LECLSFSVLNKDEEDVSSDFSRNTNSNIRRKDEEEEGNFQKTREREEEFKK
jgi:hypothetical protein